LLSKYKSVDDLELLIQITNSNVLQVQFFDGNDDNYVVYSITHTFTTGDNYLTVVYDASQSLADKLLVYINGASKTISVANQIGIFTKVSNSAAKLYIGNTQFFPVNQYYNGMIDYIYIKSEKISISEHQKNYNYWSTH